LKGISLMTAVRARLMRRLLWASCALVLSGTALLASCGGYSNITYGTAVVTMGNAGTVSGDFSSYIVEVTALYLTRSDGVIIPTLGTVSETVDLVKLHDLTELVQAPAVPVGTYTTLTVTLNYSFAEITANVNGVPTTLAPKDTQGNAMLVSTLTLTFDPGHQLVISGGACTRLAIDFNLAASNTINASASPPKVTVQPFMTATVTTADQTVMRARGLFVIAQPPSSDFVLNLRPFIDASSALGALTVGITGTTYFNINGVAYTGAAGLAAMQGLPVNTPVAAYGTLGSFATITPGFNATAVYVGTSLESLVADYLTGTVSAVNGNTLTLHAATARPAETHAVLALFYPSLPVTVGANTIVSEDGVAANALTTKSISVGQRITVSGQGATDSTTHLLTTLDATQGQVRLQPTPVWGHLNSAVAGSMALNVLLLDGYQPGVFTFAGTGTAAANDAVPTSYAVNTGPLDESATPAGTLLLATGTVTPFGSAPPDFTASSVTLGTATPQILVVEWENGGAASPFSSASSAGLVVDLSNANLSSTIRYIATGPAQTDLKTLAASPTIAFASGAALTLAVGNAAAINVFESASAFATKLSSTLNGTNLVYRLVCVGQYSNATNTFTATQVTVNL
jgi:hypothetical protein